MSMDSLSDEAASAAVDVGDADSGRMRVCARPCYSCILQPNPDKRLLEPRTLRAFLDRIAASDAFVVCHNTAADLPLGDGAPAAVCAGYMDERVPENEQEWRRSWRAREIKRMGLELPVPPPSPPRSTTTAEAIGRE